ncbi:MAG: hypothetical protein ACXWVM_01465 [Polyangiales bacterium]
MAFLGCSAREPSSDPDAGLQVDAPSAHLEKACPPPSIDDCPGGCGTCETCACNLTFGAWMCKAVAGCCQGDADCTPYKCNGGSPGIEGTCYTTCIGAAGCSAGTCSGSACINWVPNGGKCGVDADCVSNHCADGYCCNTACTGTCESCNQAGALGTCKAIPAGSQPTNTGFSPTRPACASPTGGACGSSCNGLDHTACHYGTTTTSCGAAVCNGVTNQQTLQLCNGSGTCAGVTSGCSPYTCDGAKGTCCTSCTTAGCGCASGFLCNASGICAAPGGKGAACSSPGECGSPLTCSTEGDCCTTTCSDTTNYTCKYPGKAGDCVKKDGIACTANAECGSGSCVDGVCCNSTCTDQCSSCNQVGKLGQCLPVPAGSDPVTGTSAARPPCSGVGVGTACGPHCNGTDTKACHYSTSTCSSDACSTGVETHLSTCNGAGTCSDSPTACSPYKCGATACKKSCTVPTSAADCASGFSCNAAGVCVPPAGLGGACPCSTGTCVGGVCCATATCPAGQNCNPTGGTPGICGKNIGAACASSGECGSGHCVDGVCCNTACGSSCESCSEAGKIGTCTVVSGQPRGTRSCVGTAPGTTCGILCDGKTATSCSYPDSSITCGSPSCTGDTEHHVGTCDGSGACSDSPKKCGAYACDAVAKTCKTTCAGSADCQPGFQCKTGSCVPLPKLGDPCTTGTECPTGFCTDGVCCGFATCGAGKTCAGSMPGTCSKSKGTACTADAECGTGFCTDGVCCDKKCDGQCEACDISGTGDCAVVPTGQKPHGTVRPKCDDGGGEICKGKVCDGSDRTACGKLPDSSTACSAANCTGDKKTSAGACDGFGMCSAGKTTSCSPYACGEGTDCRSSCTNDTHCAEGFICQSGKCQPKPGPKCSSDGLSKTDPDGSNPVSCAPYKCSGPGICGTECAQTSDCIDGNICDQSTKLCQPAPAASGTDSSGGCAMGSSQNAGGFAAALALLALVSTRRRVKRA